MQLIYEGKDISQAVDVNKAEITDNSGGKADSLDIMFNDPEGMWSKWKPRKDHKLQIIQNGFDSGLMYIDELEQQRGRFTVRALSIPQIAKTDNTKAWEKVRFLVLANEISTKYGFKIETHGIENHFYERIVQAEMADFEFLAFRCMLEGYSIKITGQKVVIYDERYMEKLPAARSISLEQFDGPYKFKETSTGMYGACKVLYGEYQYEYKSCAGPTLKVKDIPVYSPGEAERYSKGLLRSKNKYERSGSCTIRLDTGITAGNVINILGVGLADGKYFCEQAIHKIVEEKTSLKLRKVLEGY